MGAPRFSHVLVDDPSARLAGGEGLPPLVVVARRGGVAALLARGYEVRFASPTLTVVQTPAGDGVAPPPSPPLRRRQSP